MARRNLDYSLELEDNETQFADENNNENIDDKNNIKQVKKLTYELPPDYTYEVPKCICNRPRESFECGNCHHYFYGRIRKLCKAHPSDAFLMDFGECPYCLAPTKDCKASNLTWDEIRKIEDAVLPSDDDDL